MKLITKKNHTPKVAVFTLSALAVAPFLNPVAAQPAPPTTRGEMQSAPGWLKGNKNTTNVVVRGTVQSNVSGGDFTLRSDNKRTYRVISRTAVAGLSKGDQVQVRGFIRNNMLIADSVQILQNLNRNVNANAQRTTLNGTVLTDFRAGSFQVRGANGRTYVVVTRAEPPQLSINDSVRIVGTLDRNGRTIFADSVRITKNNAGWNNVSGTLNFQGTVTRVASAFRIDVRGDNKRDYAINSVNRLAANINAGDRVRVIGTNIGRDTVRATQVTLVSDVNRPAVNRPVVTPRPVVGTLTNFPGRVESLVGSRNGVTTLRVRGNNGVLYTVHYRTTTRFAVGDVVRVIGRASNNVVNATTVTR